MPTRLVRSSTSIGLLVLVNLFWGTQFTAYRLVSDQIGPITVTFLTFLIATPLLLPLYLAEYWSKRASCRTGSSEKRSLRRGNNLIPLLVVGVSGAAVSVFLAWGTARTTASNAALLTLTIPILTALLAVAILRERMTPARWMSLAVALAGALVLSIRPPEAAVKEGLAIDWRELGLVNRDYMVGNLLVLFACVGSCLYNVACKSLLSRFSAVEVLVWGYCFALAASAGLLVSFEPTSPTVLAGYSIRTWTGLLLLGIVAQALPMLLWMFLLTRLDVSQASVSVYLMPLFGVLLAAIFLGEQVSASMVIGGTITLAGTALLVFCEGAEPCQQQQVKRLLPEYQGHLGRHDDP